MRRSFVGACLMRNWKKEEGGGASLNPCSQADLATRAILRFRLASISTAA